MQIANRVHGARSSVVQWDLFPCAVLALLLLAGCATKPQQPLTAGTLTLELEPPDAAVTLPDIVPRYEPGMRLPEGAVRVVVRRSGYEDATRTVEVSGETRVRIALRRIGGAFTVSTTPENALVRLLDHGIAYRAGMSLPAGDYRVEVSAEGYRTALLVIRHGMSATRREVSLERAAQMRAGARFRDALSSGGEGPEMVVIPPGSFRMGCLNDTGDCRGDEKPVRVVRIGAPFALGVREVARGEFDRFVSATRRPMGDSCHVWNRGKWEEQSGFGWRRPGFAQTDDHPAVCVNWDDAQAYAAWLSRETGETYRLPSEAEWEYAVRAGTATKYHWGDGVGGNRANCDGCGSRWDDKGTAPVGSFAANAWGLHDMHGNAWEWTQDCWNDSYRGAPADGRAWTSGRCERRVLRGGSWDFNAWYLRSASRNGDATGYRISSNGFRVVRVLAP